MKNVKQKKTLEKLRKIGLRNVNKNTKLSKVLVSLIGFFVNQSLSLAKESLNKTVLAMVLCLRD